MFSPLSLKLTNWTLAICMIVQPILAAIPPEAVRAAAVEAAPEVTPEVAAAEPLTATVPAPLLANSASDASSAAAAASTQVDAATLARVEEDFGKLPLYFVKNQGQMDEDVAYYIQGKDKTIYFTPDGLTFALTAPSEEATNTPNTSIDLLDPLTAEFAPNQEMPAPSQRYAVKLDFVGANHVTPMGRNKTEAIISYFKGDPDEWQTGLPTYSSIVYPNLWPGIDLVYSGTVDQMKYEFVVAPGADPSQIQLAYRGATEVVINDDGQLEVNTPVGSFADDVPVAYQEIDGERVDVEMAYAPFSDETEGTYSYSFALGSYNSAYPLILDPAVLVTCGYIGGSGGGDSGYGITVDSTGSIYVVGETYFSEDYPTEEDTFPVTIGPNLTRSGGSDVFVAKLNSASTGLVYAGYIGGSGWEIGRDIAVDNEGNAYITGGTGSTEATFPVMVGPDLTYNASSDPFDNDADVFVTKINATGTGLIYAGYIGGSDEEGGAGIAVDSIGNAYIVGTTNSTEDDAFPVAVGPDLTFNGDSYGPDVFVAKVKGDGSGLDYAGYIGGTLEEWGNDVAVDDLGNAYITGTTCSSEATFPIEIGPYLTGGGCTAFAAKVNATGTDLLYAGYIAASGESAGFGIVVDNTDNAYVAGSIRYSTASFPVESGLDLTPNGLNDAFVAKIRADGTGLIYASFIGGIDEDFGTGIAIDNEGNAYLTGHTSSNEDTFPVTGGPDLTHNGGVYDAFIAKVRSDGTELDYAGYVGGAGGDEGRSIVVDSAGSAYVAGYTLSDEDTFPDEVGPDLTYNGDGDAFVAKVTFVPDFIVNSELDIIDYDVSDPHCDIGPEDGIPNNEICTLRAAIMQSNALEGEQTISVPAGHYVLTIVGADEDASRTGDLDITEDLTLIGGGAATTIIDANHIDGVLHIDLTTTVHISGVTIQNGNGFRGGGIRGGYLVLTDSFITGNAAYYGGGIYGSSTIINSTISGNSAGYGGGITAWQHTDIQIINSTISGNTASMAGGAIFAYGGDAQDPRIWLLNATVTGNNAPAESAALIYRTETGSRQGVWLENTLIADNAGQNCLTEHVTTPGDPAFVSDGHNLSSDDTCNLTDPTDTITANPGLDPELQPNGGPTPTHALLPGSPAVDKINAEDCPATDQRGVERPQGSACDIGAYEFDGAYGFYGGARWTGGGTDWPVDTYVKQTQAYIGNPINTANGNQTYETVDLRLPTAAGEIYFSRSYSSYNAYYDYSPTEGELPDPQNGAGSMGPGWLHNYETQLYFPPGNTKITMGTPGGNRAGFTLVSEDPKDTYTAEDGAGGQLVRESAQGRLVYTSPEGIDLIFYDHDQGDLAGRLDEINFHLAGTVKLEYDPVTHWLTTVYDSNHKETAYMAFGYSSAADYPYGNGQHAIRLKTVSLSNGRSITFDYRVFGQMAQSLFYWNTNLTSFIDVRNQTWEYIYAEDTTHPEPALDYETYPYLRYFLVGRQMPQGATIIKYDYEMITGNPVGMPAASSVRELDGADQPMVTIDYGTSQAIAHYGTQPDEEAPYVGPNVQQVFDVHDRLTQEQIVNQAGASIQYQGWQTQYVSDPQDPNRPIYRPARVTDPYGHDTDYTWTDNNLSLAKVTNLFYTFYQYVSENTGLHLPEIILYPYQRNSTAAKPVQTRLIYNTPKVADPAAIYPATGEANRVNNPYLAELNPTGEPGDDKPYPGLPPQLLLGRIDAPNTAGEGFETRYYYYDSGPQTALVRCIAVPAPGGDTFYVYNDVRQPIDIYEGCDCGAKGETHSGGLPTHIEYDSLDRVTSITRPSGVGGQASLTTAYEYLGNSDLPSLVTQNADASKTILEEDSSGVWNIRTAYYYDLAGRLMATIENYHPTYSGGTLVSPDLDGDGSLDSYRIDPEAPHVNRATLYRYAAAGRVVEVIANYDGSDLDEAADYYKHGLYNFSTRTVYDGAGRVAAVIENYTPGNVAYDLDGDGQAETEYKLSLSPDAPDRNRITMNRYNSLGRLMVVISPAWPSTAGEPEPYQPKTTSTGQVVIYNRMTAYEYDAVGNVTKTIANFDESVTGEMTLDVSLDPGVPTPLQVSTAQPDHNVATCTTYDALNRPVLTYSACINRVWGDYHSVNGNVYNLATYTAYDDLSRPIVLVENFKEGSGGKLTVTAEYNHITRLYYDSLGRVEWTVREMIGDTTRDIVEVLIDPILSLREYNLVTRSYYDAQTGQPIAVVENYREKFDGVGAVDLELIPEEIEAGLSLGHNHVTHTFYAPEGNSLLPTGLVEAVTSNFVGDIVNASAPPAFGSDRNLTTRYDIYDDLNRPRAATILRGDEQLTSAQVYDNLGRIISSTFDVLGEQRVTTTAYAKLGFDVTTTDPAGKVARTIADARGNPSTTVAPGTLDLTVSNDYDLFGRVTHSDDGENAPVETTYDALGQVLQVSSTGQVTIDGQVRNVSQITTYSYNLLGQVVVAKTEGTGEDNEYACSATAYQYDNAGSLLRVVENYTNPGGCAPNDVEFPKDVETEYRYDEMGNLVSVELAHESTVPTGSTKEYQYDALGQTIFEVLDPAGQKLFTRYCYDAAGSVTRTLRGSGKASAGDVPCDATDAAYLITQYTYDNLGRPLHIDYEDAGNGLEAAADVTYTYDAFGNRATMVEDGGRTWTYDIDSDGLLDSVSWTQGGTSGQEVTYQYDAAGNRTGLVAPGLLDTRYISDDAGRLECIDMDGNDDCDSADVGYRYNDASQVTQVELPGGMTSNYTYDPLGRLDMLSHQIGGVIASSFDYDLDGLGNRIGANETMVGPTAQPLTLATFGTANPDEDVALPGFMPETEVLDAPLPSAEDKVKLPVAPEPRPVLPEAPEITAPAQAGSLGSTQTGTPTVAQTAVASQTPLEAEISEPLPMPVEGPTAGSLAGEALSNSRVTNITPTVISAPEATPSPTEMTAVAPVQAEEASPTPTATPAPTVTPTNTAAPTSTPPSSVLELGLHQETDPRITYSGTWTPTTYSLASGGTLIRTFTGSASFEFLGSRLALYQLRNTSCHSMRVCIDGACETAGIRSLVNMWQQPWVKSGLSYGIHLVTIGDFSGYVSDRNCNLDAVEVLGPPQPLEPGLHQENNLNLDYSGSWTSATTVNASGSTVLSTAQQGASVSFSFDGADVVLYRTTGPDYGPMDVCIDGTCQSVQNSAPMNLWIQPWKTDGLEAGPHTITISNPSTQTINLDAIEVLDGLQHPLVSGLHQQNDPRISYSGAWTTVVGSELSGGTAASASDPEASASFQIEGTGLVIYRTTGPNQGPMNVCIDTNCQAVQNTSETALWQQPWAQTGLAAGVHTITLNSSSTSSIELDAIEVMEPLPVGLYEPADSRIVYTGYWNGEDIRTTYMDDALVSFWFEGSGFVLTRRIGVWRISFSGSSFDRMEVCIDDICEEVLNRFGNISTQWHPWVKNGLVTGLHHVTVRDIGYSTLSLDSVEVLGASYPLAVGLHQETDPNLIYTGKWQELANTGGAFSLYTEQPGARVSFQFDGTGLTLYRSTGPTQGSMEVCIDETCETVSNQSATALWSQPWTSAGLSDKTHDVTITSLSTSRIDLDAVEVLEPTEPLEVGAYEETEPRLAYVGTWTTSTNANASGGAFTETSQQDALVRFSFEGNKLTLFRSMGSDRGPMEVCIDGVCETVQNTSATALWQQPWTKTGLTMAVHQVAIRNTSTAVVDLDAVVVDEAEGTQPLVPGTYEETEPRLVYNGNWASATASGASGGAVKQTSDPGANVIFSFIGDGLVLYRTTAPGYGSMDVCIDGVCTPVDNFSTIELRQQPWTSDALEAGLHQATLRNTSTTTIDLDAVEVQGEPQPLETGYYEETNINLTYEGQWTSQPGSGPSGGALALTVDPTAGVSFRFNGNMLTLYRAMGPAYGLMQVCIDGTCEQVQNNAAAEQWQQPWASPDLANGLHEVVITPVSAASINLDAIRVMAPLGVGLHQEDNARISYTGNWSDISGSGPIGGSMRTTSDPAATVSFQFEGSKLTLYRAMAPSYGPVQVCIDGTCETMENTAPSMQWAEPWVKSGLPSGIHSVAIENPESSTYGLDAAKVTGPHNWGYQYDGLRRLVTACSNGWNAATNTCTGDRFTYSYDLASNLESFTRARPGDVVRPEMVHFVIDDATNQVDCAAANGGTCIAYVYDNLGNLTSDGVSTYTYDTANRLVQVVGPTGTTRYEYNGDGDRIAETHGSERTDFTLDVAAGLTQVLAETTNGQTVTYLYGLGLVAQTSGGATEHLLADALGSVRQTVDTDGRVLLAQTFDPYGNLYEQSDGTPPSFGWTGQQSDPNGLTYLRARYYAPTMGRFTQLDPFAGALALPSSLNGYAYGHGNPTRYTDPEGLCGPLCWAAITVGLVGLGVFTWDYGSQVDYNMQQGMDFWTAADPANVEWERSATYGLLAAGITAGAICYLYLPCAIAASSALATVGPYAEAAFYGYGIYLGARKLTGINPPGDQELMDYAFMYHAGLQMQLGPAVGQAKAVARIQGDEIIARRLANLNEFSGVSSIPRGSFSDLAAQNGARIRAYQNQNVSLITRTARPYVDQVPEIRLRAGAPFRGVVGIFDFTIEGAGTGGWAALSGYRSNPGVIDAPPIRRFQTRPLPGENNPRTFDAEDKLLEYAFVRLPSDAKGTATLYSQLRPCGSCRGVIRQFRTLFPDVELTVLWGGAPE